MNKSALILTLGLFAGASAHFGYFEWQRPGASSVAAESLSWMRTELKLNAEQYAKIVALHEQSGSHLKELSSKLEAMRQQYAHFEATRLNSDEVDFIAFAKFVETRKGLDKDCTESARSLVTETSEVLNPSQRGRFRQLLAAGGGQRLISQ